MTKQEALALLKEKGMGWFASGPSDDSDDWKVLLRSADDECVDCVKVEIMTRIDLEVDTLTDEDWIAQGKFLAEVAADERRMLMS